MKNTEKWIVPVACGKNAGKALPEMPPLSPRPLRARSLAPALFLLLGAACDRTPPPGATAAPSGAPAAPQAGSPTLPKELQASPRASAVAGASAAPASSEGAAGIAAPGSAPPAD